MTDGVEGSKYKKEHLLEAMDGLINSHFGPFHQASAYNGRLNKFFQIILDIFIFKLKNFSIFGYLKIKYFTRQL